MVRILFKLNIPYMIQEIEQNDNWKISKQYKYKIMKNFR